MKNRIAWSIGLVLIAGTIASQAQEGKKAAAKNPALEQFKQLAGEWVGKGKHGNLEFDARVVYKVTSGGTAVVETIDPGGAHEMVTIIHADGDALVLTHYCMIGNQPHMKAMPKVGDSKFAFQFVKATNMKSEKDMHMRNVTFTFLDKETLQTEWTNFMDGKEAGKMIFELKRKK